MTALSPDKLLLRRDTRGRESLYTLSFNGNSASGATAVGDPASSSVAPFIFTPDGKVRYVTAGALWEISPDGVASVIARLPDELASDAIACAGTVASVWAAGHTGLARYGYNPASGWSMLSDRYIPAPLSVKQVAYIIPSADGQRAYFTNLGATVYRLGYPTGDEGFNRV